MLSANFAVALVTVVLRGLVDRLLNVAPILKTSAVPHTAGLVIISGTLFFIYDYLKKNRPIRFRASTPQRRDKILDGRIHKNPIQLPHRNLKERRRNCQSRSSRSRSRENLLNATKESLQLLQTEFSSSSSIGSFKSATASEPQSTCICSHNTESHEDKVETTSSVCSVKSTGQELIEKLEGRLDKNDFSRFNGYGDCVWERRRRGNARKRRRRVKRKTRSGKIYSVYDLHVPEEF